MSTYVITVRGDVADRHGIDDGGQFRCQVLGRTDRFIALKIPGGKFWSSRGQQGYASPRVEVYEIVEVLEKGADRYRIKTVLEWSAGRKPQ